MLTGKQALEIETDEDWIEALKKSVTTPIINGHHMARFPVASVQARIMGSADAAAIAEGAKFFHYAKAYAEALGNPIHEGTKLLDFGVGWGRYPRIFAGDISPLGIHGVDVDPEMVYGCRTLGVPGTFQQIDPRGRLPFPDKTFDMVISYSVFSHLPEDLAMAWAKEISRVCKPGAIFVFTTEPRRFLEFVAAIAEPAESPWHAGLARFKSMIPELLEKCDAGELCYIPTSGGEHLPASDYGDTVIPEAYLKEKWADLFHHCAYVDDPNVFWQACVIMQKPNDL
jgi:SAM-dependent methyltransferase